MEICESIQAIDANCAGCGFNVTGMCKIAFIEESRGRLPTYDEVWHMIVVDRRLSMNCPRGYEIINSRLVKNG